MRNRSEETSQNKCVAWCPGDGAPWPVHTSAVGVEMIGFVDMRTLWHKCYFHLPSIPFPFFWLQDSFFGVRGPALRLQVWALTLAWPKHTELSWLLPWPSMHDESIPQACARILGEGLLPWARAELLEYMSLTAVVIAVTTWVEICLKMKQKQWKSELMWWETSSYGQGAPGPAMQKPFLIYFWYLTLSIELIHSIPPCANLSWASNSFHPKSRQLEAPWDSLSSWPCPYQLHKPMPSSRMSKEQYFYILPFSCLWFLYPLTSVRAGSRSTVTFLQHEAIALIFN